MFTGVQSSALAKSAAINHHSQFPMIVIALSGDLQERTLLQYARDLREEVKLVNGVLDAEITGMDIDDL